MIPTQTLARYIRYQERRHTGTSGELSDLLSAISLGVKMIGDLVASAGLKGLRGYTGTKNIQGEEIHVLDREADEILVQILGSSGHFGLIVSEERDQVVATQEGRDDSQYVLAFDPLDGSSNLGSNIPVGTIFSIWRKRNKNMPAEIADFLQPGSKLVAAGYAVYGAKTSFVYSAGDGTHEFTLDPDIGEFMLTEEFVRIPEQGTLYSVNEGNSYQWSKPIQDYVDSLKQPDTARGTPLSARYVGSLVADFDRNMKKGGIYLYPPDKKNTSGKLRLLYECIPLAFIAEQAGGKSTDGTRSVLEIIPQDIHQRSPLYIGSTREVQSLIAALAGRAARS